MPGGRVRPMPFSSCSPSLREMRTVKGVKAPAAVGAGVAETGGRKRRSGIVFAQAPASGARGRVNPLSGGPPSGVPDQAVIAWVVIWAPQVAGLVSVAL